MFTTNNIVPFSELNTQQQAISEFGRKLGTPVIYFKGNPKLNGAHLDGATYINVNAKLFTGGFSGTKLFTGSRITIQTFTTK